MLRPRFCKLAIPRRPRLIITFTCNAAVARSAYTIARTLFSLGDNAVSTLAAVRSNQTLRHPPTRMLGCSRKARTTAPMSLDATAELSGSTAQKSGLAAAARVRR